MSENTARHVHFQYGDAEHQATTALDGMWLFLAQEMLFFGALILTYAFCLHQHPAGFALAGRHTELAIGTINTVLLLTSSAAYTTGLAAIERGNRRRLLWCLAITFGLGVGFLAMKGIEWGLDFRDHLFPGPGFGLVGPDRGGAEIFYAWYFIATGLHGVHMIIGLALLAWLFRRAKAGFYHPGHVTGVEVMGLYWSFVDIVWIVLYPLIYLLGRTT